MIRPLAAASPSTAIAAEGVAVARTSPDASQPAPVVADAVPRPDVEAAVGMANRALATREATLEFQIDPDTKSVVVRLVDTQDHQVLRQVPSDEMIAIARSIDRMELALLRNEA